MGETEKTAAEDLKERLRLVQQIVDVQAYWESLNSPKGVAYMRIELDGRKHVMRRLLEDSQQDDSPKDDRDEITSAELKYQADTAVWNEIEKLAARKPSGLYREWKFFGLFKIADSTRRTPTQQFYDAIISKKTENLKNIYDEIMATQQKIAKRKR